MNYEETIEKIITDPAAMGLPHNAPVIAMYLSSWRPMIPPAQGSDNMTSLSIAGEFEDICPVSTQDVSAVMLKLGYRLECGGFMGIRWSMRRAEDSDDEK